ncbi:MAG: hypothetical protein J0L92_41125 [Deltaproteobacteria bacterium]|nr:hypothetical protein [Deltaproteobacteria bacterium]
MSSHLDEASLACLALEESDGDATERAHLATCAVCGERLREQRDVLAAIERARATKAPTREELASLRTRVLGSIAPRLDVWTGVAVVAVGVALIASFGDAFAIERLVPSVALLVVAGCLAAWSSTLARARVAVASLVVGTVLVAAIDLNTVGEVLDRAFGCERFIALAAVVPCASALYAQHRSMRGSSLERTYAGALGAASGAIAAQAALLTWCRHEAGLVHVLGFHVVTVLAVTALGALAGRLAPHPVR